MELLIPVVEMQVQILVVAVVVRRLIVQEMVVQV
jgi:hypothetical protein